MKFQFQSKLDLCSGNHVVYRWMDRQGESSTPIAHPQAKSKSEGFDSCDRCSNLTQIRFKWSLFQPVWPWNLMDDLKQGKSEGFDSCDRPGNLTQNGFNRRFFSLCDLEIWWMASKNYRAPIPHYIKLCASFQSHQWIESAWSYSPETLNSGQNQRFFVLCDLEIWWMTSKSYTAPPLCYNKLCAWFQSHQWIQTKVTVRKLLIRVKIGNFLSRVTLKFDGWPWKTIGHLFYATLNFVHHFKAIGGFKLELQSGNAQFGSKSAIFCPVTFKFDGWHWKTIGHLFYVASSFLHHFIAISEFKLKLQSGNAQFGSKPTIFCPVWPSNLTDDFEK